MRSLFYVFSAALSLSIGSAFALPTTQNAVQNEQIQQMHSNVQEGQTQNMQPAAQEGQMQSTGSLFTHGGLLFNANTVTSLSGKIVNIETVDIPNNQNNGIHLTFQSNGKNYEVPAGPEWYMKRIGLNLEANQNIKIEGSLVNVNGRELLIPSSINMGGKNYILRDSQGIPSWRGHGHGFGQRRGRF